MMCDNSITIKSLHTQCYLIGLIEEKGSMHLILLGGWGNEVPLFLSKIFLIFTDFFCK